ncbi:MAG: ATPase domain-containing protein [Thermoplasmata archaeon]
MDGATGGAMAAPEGSSSGADDLARALGLSRGTAQRLVDAGYASAPAVRELSTETLDRLGVTAEERDAIRRSSPSPDVAAAPAAPSAASVNADQIVERWVGNVQRADRGRKRRLPTAAKGSTDVLRKWVDGDDRAMEDWIRSSDTERPAPVAPAPPMTAGTEEGALLPRTAEPGGLPTVSEREETVVRWLTGLLDRVKSDQFDPSSMIQEVQDLQRQLYDERTKRKQLEDQVEHVKRGSIAVIKYVRSREAKERELAVRAKEAEVADLRLRLTALNGSPGGPGALPEAPAGDGAPSSGSDPGAVERAIRDTELRLRNEFSDHEHQFIERETELRRRVVQLEGEIRSLSSVAQQAEGRAELVGKQGSPIAEDVTRRLEELTLKERDLVARENELRAKFEEIRINAEEVERRRGPLEFKERELAVYDQQLQTRRQALDIEARRLEEHRREAGIGGVAKTSEGARLDDMRHELAKKEAELRARETQLQDQVRELEKLAGRAAEADADQMHADSVAAAESPKVRSGVRRLDDLLFGGFAAGTQILLNGPAHTGKDVLARLFSTEGLRVGIPSLWVVTDKSYGQVRDDLATLYPGLADAEKKGMLRFVDLYSLSVGSSAPVPGVRFLSSTGKAVLDQLAQSVNGFGEELKSKFSTYRLIFESVSTITAYLDTASTFRFLQPFVGRRKLDGAVGYYVLESGMHSESDLETLEHMVDGSLNLKIDQMKTFLSVRGIGEAQARSWVGYTFTKRSFNLGSFSLEHIR